MSATPWASAVWTLAWDVVRQANRRRILPCYLVLGTASAVAVVCGIELRAIQARPVVAALSGQVPLPAPGRPLPGTLKLVTVDRHLLQDGGAGQLVDDQGRALGRLDPDGGRLQLTGTVAVPRSASLSWEVEISRRAQRAAVGTPHQVVLRSLGAERRYPDDPAAPPGPAELVSRTLCLAWVFQLLLIFGVAVGGQGLGLVAVADAVPQAFTAGAAPLLLPRPVSRAQVVLGRFAGGVLFAGLQVAWTLGVALLGLWLRLELCPWELLLAGAVELLKFGLLLSVCSYAALLTRSAILGVVGAVGVWAVSFSLTLLGAEAGSLSTLREVLHVEAALRWLGLVWPPIASQDDLARWAVGLTGDPWAALGTLVRGLVWIVVLSTLSCLAVRRRDC